MLRDVSLLSKNNKVKHIIFHSIGYHKLRLEISAGEIHQMDIQLEPNSQDLSEVSISVAHKPRYKNKDNPAVELIRRVIEHKKSNAANLQNYLSYQEYEKLNISFIGYEKQRHPTAKKLSFLKDNSDSLTSPADC